MYGYDRNWERLCLTLDGFHARHGAWPQRVRLYPVCFEELRHLFRPADFTTLMSKVALIPDDDAEFIAEDDAGRVFDYGQEADTEDVTGERSAAWLGVKMVSAEDLFGWDEEGGGTRATEPFQLADGRWYAMELWGAFSRDKAHDSPVRIRQVRPSGEGTGRLDVTFFHANHPGGSRHRELTLRVLHRGRRWLVALRANAPEESVMVLFPLTQRWLKEHAPVLARRKGTEPLAQHLDRIYRFEQPVEAGK